MGVSATVGCLDCGDWAPDPGDGGHVGFPSLEDGAGCGDFVSFESIFRGYSAIGLRLADLDRIHAWLVEHASHRVQLSFDGNPVGRARKPLARGRAAATTPSEVGGHDLAFVELTCRRCSQSWRSKQSVRVQPVDRPLAAEEISVFEERVLEVDDVNFHRTFGLLDRRSEDSLALLTFVRRHRKHAPSVRTVVGERWQAPALPARRLDRPAASHLEPGATPSRRLSTGSFPPPLCSAWTFDAAARSSILVDHRRTYAMVGKRDAVVALDELGRVLWQSPTFEAFALSDMHLQESTLWLPVWLKGSRGNSSQLWAVDTDTGAARLVAEDAPSPATFVAPGRFVGVRYRPNNRMVESVGVFDLSPGLRVVWELEVVSDLGKGRLGAALAAAANKLFVTRGASILALDAGTGRQAWSADLAAFQRASWDNRLTISASQKTVVSGLSGSLHGLSIETGATLWSSTIAEVGLFRTHCEDDLYLAARAAISGSPLERAFCRLSADSGQVICRSDPSSPVWREAPQPPPRFTTSPRPVDECVYLGDVDGRLWALDIRTGDPIWAQGLRGATSGLEQIVIAGDRLLVQDYSGTLFCWKPAV